MTTFNKDVLCGIDIGATSIKAGLFSIDGKLIKTASRPNAPKQQTNGEAGWLVWDCDELWEKVSQCIKEVLEAIESRGLVRGVAVTGFGVDGVPMTNDGEELYPIISWHDTRTIEQRDWLSRQLDPFEIYRISGFHNYHINTINKLRWLVENHPEILEKTYRWLMVQDYIAYKLSGGFSTEWTIASTTMAYDQNTWEWSDKLLELAGVDKAIFPEIVSPGTVIGTVMKSASLKTGLPEGTPVAAGGHDCEVGALGCGVANSDIFIDITGTWEMIIAILNEFVPRQELFDSGIDFECHTFKGEHLCQSLMIAGGVIEWMRDKFYANVPRDSVYQTMIAEAADVPAGSQGVYIVPSFMKGMGPYQAYNSMGSILGLTTTTSRGQIARAALEGMCYRLKNQIDVIEKYTGSACRKLRVLGGGQKNELWLQMKADVTGRPVEITTNEDVTIHGAAILAGVGSGVYRDARSALTSIDFPVITYEPSEKMNKLYEEYFTTIYEKIPVSLKDIYRNIR